MKKFYKRRLLIISLLMLIIILVNCTKMTPMPSVVTSEVTITLTPFTPISKSEIVTSISTPTIIIPTPNDAIPTPDYFYLSCLPSPQIKCIIANTPVTDVLARVIFLEGGGIIAQAAPDILQVIHNKLWASWTCSTRENCIVLAWKLLNPNNISWEKISQEQFVRLLLWGLSESYTGGDGVKYPAFNVWATPFDWTAVNQNPYILKLYSAILQMAIDYLQDGYYTEIGNISMKEPLGGYNIIPQYPIIKNKVQYFSLVKNELPTDIIIYATDSYNTPDGLYTIIFSDSAYNEVK